MRRLRSLYERRDVRFEGVGSLAYSVYVAVVTAAVVLMLLAPDAIAGRLR